MVNLVQYHVATLVDNGYRVGLIKPQQDVDDLKSYTAKAQRKVIIGRIRKQSWVNASISQLVVSPLIPIYLWMA